MVHCRRNGTVVVVKRYTFGNEDYLLCCSLFRVPAMLLPASCCSAVVVEQWLSSDMSSS